jgi:hypothetical protein
VHALLVSRPQPQEEVPAKSVPTGVCQPCAAPYNLNKCGSGTGLSIYSADAVAYFAPPPPDIEHAPPTV